MLNYDDIIAILRMTPDNALTMCAANCIDNLQRQVGGILKIVAERDPFDGENLDYMQGYRDGEYSVEKRVREFMTKLRPPNS